MKEFYHHDLSNANPYQANETNQGLLTTTKLLCESVKLNVSSVESLNSIILIFAGLIAIVAISIVIVNARAVKRIQYLLYENVIECQNTSYTGKSKKFFLAQDSRVFMHRSLKGCIFGYGTLKISQGSGYAGEFTMVSIRNVQAAKKAILIAISKHGRRHPEHNEEEMTPCSYPCSSPFPTSFPFQQGLPMPYAPMTAPMPLPPCANACQEEEEDSFEFED